MVGQVSKFPEWRVIVDLLRSAEYGETVTHGDIAASTQLMAGTDVYYRHMGQARRVLLREHDLEVESVPTVGYKRVEPNRYGERARRETRLGSKRIRRGRRVVKAAPVHLLTAAQVAELEHTMLMLAALSTQASKVIRSMKNVLPPVAAKAIGPGSGESDTGHS